ESSILTHEEKLTLFRTVKEVVGDQAAVIAGTGSNNTAASEALTAEATALGVDGVMLVTPYYNKPSQEGLYQHFLACARATSLPVMLYNVPGRTGVNLLPETVVRLAAVENIVALKEASGNLDQASEILRLVPPHFRVYSGDDSLTLPLVAIGAYGVVSVASHLVGKELQAMVNGLVAGRVAEAQAIHRRLFPLFKALFMAPNPVPIKAALALLGRPAGRPRPPLVALSESEEATLRRVLHEVGLLPQ
ncbi:MAG: 4-hydroxy-tetrahydrodipicolinate synthase, partial [Clostridia bacterium]|nr:4-hydroxy-tetrahydrodipicolinate synthase [Clostridia bacterium]